MKLYIGMFLTCAACLWFGYPDPVNWLAMAFYVMYAFVAGSFVKSPRHMYWILSNTELGLRNPMHSFNQKQALWDEYKRVDASMTAHMVYYLIPLVLTGGLYVMFYIAGSPVSAMIGLVCMIVGRWHVQWWCRNRDKFAIREGAEAAGLKM